MRILDKVFNKNYYEIKYFEQSGRIYEYLGIKSFRKALLHIAKRRKNEVTFKNYFLKEYSNPAMNYEKGFGLNNYGITLFDKEGAEVILSLAKAWAELFSSGPATLRLTGNYCFTGNDTYMPEGSYEIIEISRDKLIESFRKLQLFSERGICNKYLILHYGI